MLGAASHFGIDRGLVLGHDFGQQRQLVPLPALDTFQPGAFADGRLERDHAWPAAEAHHQPPAAAIRWTLVRRLGGPGWCARCVWASQ